MAKSKLVKVNEKIEEKVGEALAQRDKNEAEES